MLEDDYLLVIKDIKERIRQAHYKIILSANRDLLILYWNIGKIIHVNSKWGNKFLDNLSKEIKRDFPNTKGFSVRNLKNMVRFYRAYEDFEFVQTVAAQITWSHNLEILSIKDKEERIWYMNKTIENGWSKNILATQINLKLYYRQNETKKISNFSKNLGNNKGEVALQFIKDPYVFDFIELEESAREKDLENALINNITKLLLELGKGFAFVGNQYHMFVAGEDYYIDLLFYNIKLKCYFVIELKTGEFKPEYAGQLSFYLTAIDEIVKEENDNPSIGLLLCRGKNNIIAEYTLRDMNKPMGVSEYRISGKLPDRFEKELPSIKELLVKIENKE